MVRKFQGKSILVSHNDQEGKSKGATGFYGANGWSELTEIGNQRGKIPQELVRNANGTSLYVIGFEAEANWRRELISSVVSNFFYAILTEKLIVEVDGAKLDGLPNRIDKDTIITIFQTLSDENLKEAEALFDTIADRNGHTSELKQPTMDGQLRHLGHTKIWIRVAEGLPNKALIVRDPGMAICDAVKRLPRMKNLPRRWGDFAAVIVCADKNGNELLRSMEPPKHDDFQPDRLKGAGVGPTAPKGRRALMELGSRIRGWIDHQMPKLDDDQVASIDELAEFFPSEDLDTPENPDGEETNPFGNSIVGETVTKLPTIRQPTRPNDIEEDGDETESTDEDGDEENGGTSEGNGNGRTSNGGGRKSTRSTSGSISGVRMYRENGTLFVAFTPEETFHGTLAISVASEERQKEDRIQITALTDEAGKEISPTGIQLESGQRVRFAVDTQTAVPDGRAVILEAFKTVKS